jgi:ATP-dependent protease ClpP protease subunit
VEKSFKYIKNISNGEGTIHLYNQIGDSVDSKGNYSYGISGSSFAYEMQYLQENCTKIHVRINSIGGNVLDGYSIVSAILNSKVECNTYIDGLAASIAGVIAVAGKKCYMADYGTLMIHNPTGGEDKKVLGIVKDTLVTILSNRTSKTPEEINRMMSKETWLSATEAKAEGMVDEIISSGKKIKVSNSLQEMAEVYNKLLTNEKPKMKEITAKLGVNEASSEAVVVSAIESIQNSNTALKTENDALKVKIQAFETEKATAIETAKNALKTKAEALGAKLVTDKKIKEEEKAAVIENASVSESAYEFVKNTFDKVSATQKAVVIFDTKNYAGKNGAEDRSTWKFSDWSKKDEKGLAKIQNESPELFQELYNAEYKKP